MLRWRNRTPILWNFEVSHRDCKEFRDLWGFQFWKEHPSQFARWLHDGLLHQPQCPNPRQCVTPTAYRQLLREQYAKKNCRAYYQSLDEQAADKRHTATIAALCGGIESSKHNDHARATYTPR